jgi:tetratricopeptide (TPR) repeat protein
MKPIQTAAIITISISTFVTNGLPRASGYAIVNNPLQLVESQAIGTTPPSNVNLLEQGIEKQEREDYVGAIADYTKFLKTYPDRLEAYSNRGFAKAMLNDLQGAIADFDRAIELAPRSADAHNGRGNVNAMAGNLTASIRDFNRAIRYDRNFADAYYNRGIGRHDLGDRRGAKLDFSQAARLFQRQQDLGGYYQAREWIDKLK